MHHCLRGDGHDKLLRLMLIEGILFDLETTNPVAPPQSIIDAFNDVKEETSNYINKFIDNPAPYQESYPAPVKEIDGQK